MVYCNRAREWASRRLIITRPPLFNHHDLSKAAEKDCFVSAMFADGSQDDDDDDVMIWIKAGGLAPFIHFPTSFWVGKQPQKLNKLDAEFAKTSFPPNMCTSSSIQDASFQFSHFTSELSIDFRPVQDRGAATICLITSIQILIFVIRIRIRVKTFVCLLFHWSRRKWANV